MYNASQYFSSFLSESDRKHGWYISRRNSLDSRQTSSSEMGLRGRMRAFQSTVACQILRRSSVGTSGKSSKVSQLGVGVPISCVRDAIVWAAFIGLEKWFDSARLTI